jgi:PBP1b-binding outer membrane lipoprotein LpoB
MKYTLLLLGALFLLGGCSAKEINANVDSITSDITNAFENSKDKSN